MLSPIFSRPPASRFHGSGTTTRAHLSPPLAAVHDPTEFGWDAPSDSEPDSLSAPDGDDIAESEQNVTKASTGGDALDRLQKAQREHPAAMRQGVALEDALNRTEREHAAIQRTEAAASGSAAAGESFEDLSVADTTTETDRLDEAKLALLVQEFGPWGDDTEHFLKQIPGALHREILIRGTLTLSNRRLFFFALIPPVKQDTFIRAGPVTSHYPGRLTTKTRVWFELRSDSISWYPSSNEMYAPLGACRLSQIKTLCPYDPRDPNRIHVALDDGFVRCFELDTAESAIGWHSDCATALFTFRATSDKLRLALPLQLVTKVVVEPVMALGERLTLHFDMGQCDGDEDGSTSAENRSRSQALEFGYFKSEHDFSEALKKQVKLLADTPACAGSWSQPLLEIDGATRAEDAHLQKSRMDDAGLAAQFCFTFALPDPPSSLYLASSCEVVRNLPTWGSLAISTRFLCFWRKSLISPSDELHIPLGGFWRKSFISSDVRLRIPLSDIAAVGPIKAFRFGLAGLAVQVHGATDVLFDFRTQTLRDEVIKRLQSALAVLEDDTAVAATNTPDSSADDSISLAPSSFETGTASLLTGHADSDFGAQAVGETLTVQELVDPLFDLQHQPLSSIFGTPGSRILTGKHFVCLTIGSRGDVQPYIALAKELIRDGNRVTIASHPEYRSWVESYGIGYQEVGGDPGALMKLSIEHRILSPGFFRESLSHFRTWLDDLFAECWTACQGADVLIESPSTMAGIHVAEALGIPYFRAFTMPWTSTSTYPQAFAASMGLGASYNLLTYTLFDNVIWKATAGQVNRWRKETLHLGPTSMRKMSQEKVPFVYNFSSAVCPKPNDWRDFICVSGYWFLDDDKPWTPPVGLMEFIEKAREDGKSIIYIGFGSIIVPDSASVTKAVATAVLSSGVRAILCKGWSDRGEVNHDDIQLPPEIFPVLSVPHDHLFPLIDAACHHGGAGTTGASLRAGIPTLIHPFFGDQFFWSSRVQKLGAGICIDTLNEKDLTAAFVRGTSDRIMREKANAVGEKIRAENGPRTALTFIYDHTDLFDSQSTWLKYEVICEQRELGWDGTQTPILRIITCPSPHHLVIGSLVDLPRFRRCGAYSQVDSD